VSTPEPTGSLAVALAHAWRLMGQRPVLAEEQARAILEASPGHPEGHLALATALRLQGRNDEALAELEPLASAHPSWPGPQAELGLAFSALGRTGEAAEALERALSLDPKMPHIWRALGDLRRLQGDQAGADRAFAGQSWLRPSTACVSI
jgi:Flp pilus assembly protein TadD